MTGNQYGNLAALFVGTGVVLIVSGRWIWPLAALGWITVVAGCRLVGQACELWDSEGRTDV